MRVLAFIAALALVGFARPAVAGKPSIRRENTGKGVTDTVIGCSTHEAALSSPLLTTKRFNCRSRKEEKTDHVQEDQMMFLALSEINLQ